MRFKMMASVAALALGACVTFMAPASAQVARGASTIAVQNDGLVQNVQYYRRYGGRGYYGRGYGYRGYDPGAAVAAGVIGLAAGAIIAGAAAPRAVMSGDPAWVDYCYSRYKSFDPASGTYLGYDGFRHPCQ